MITPATVTFELTLGDLLGALHEAFLDEFGDEELADLAVQTVLEEHLVDGSWRFDPSEDVN